LQRWKWCVSTLFLVVIWLSGCGKDEPSGPRSSLLVPASWEGVWEITITSRECDTDSVIGVDVLIDAVCTGESFEEFLGLHAADLETVRCSGTFTDQGFTATCTGSTDLFGCSVDMAGTFTAAREDTTFAGEGVLNMISTCSGEPVEDCIVAELDARFLAADPPECDAATSGFLSEVVRQLEARADQIAP
jgi:hypothetical protein